MCSCSISPTLIGSLLLAVVAEHGFSQSDNIAEKNTQPITENQSSNEANSTKQTLLTCGWFGNNVLECTLDEDCKTLVEPGVAGLGNAHSVTVGPDGLLYVTSIASNNIIRFNVVTGDFIDVFIPSGRGGLLNPTQVAFGPTDGLVYITSFGNNSVKVFDPTSGAYIEDRVSAPNNGGLNGPESITFGPDGQLYVSSRFTHSIKKYDNQTGEFLGDFIESRLGGLRQPFHIGFSDDGSVLYAGSSLTDTVIAYDGTDGSLIDIIVRDDPETPDDESGGLDNPHDVTIGPDGRMYVASFGSDEVLIYETTTGKFIESIPSTNGPQDVVFRPYNYIQDNVTVLQTYTGEASGDQFGWVSSKIDDLDGDGLNDLIITAPTNDEAGNRAGKVYVYSSNPASNPNNPIHVFTGSAAANQFGYSTGNAGDLNNDGISDIQVGAPFGGPGSVYLYSGADGTLIDTLTGEGNGDQFGTSVCPGLDYNNDGVQEIIVGAPRADAEGLNNAGKVYVYDGATRKLLSTYIGLTRGDLFGSTVSPISDQNADGHPDLLVGAPNAANNFKGQVYLYSGADQQLLCIIDNPSPQGTSLASLFLSSPGDINNDGKDDIYCTDFGSDGGKGKAYVFSFVDDQCQLLWTYTGSTGSGLGIGNGTAGDVNHDGYDDVLIGLWQLSAGAPSAGGAILYSGKDHSILREITSTVAGETLGFDIHTMGDITGDDVDDMLITAAWNPAHGAQTGRVYLIEGINPPPSCPPDITGNGSLNFYDVSAFLTAFMMSDPIADFTYDGVLNIFDIFAFLDLFSIGCP